MKFLLSIFFTLSTNPSSGNINGADDKTDGYQIIMRVYKNHTDDQENIKKIEILARQE